jgi:hypothetical protein
MPSLLFSSEAGTYWNILRVLSIGRFRAVSTFPFVLKDTREYYRRKYRCTVDLLFDQFGWVSFANKNKNRQLSYSLFQTSQTGGQQYSDTSPFSVPCSNYHKLIVISVNSTLGFSCKYLDFLVSTWLATDLYSSSLIQSIWHKVRKFVNLLPRSLKPSSAGMTSFSTARSWWWTTTENPCPSEPWGFTKLQVVT